MKHMPSIAGSTALVLLIGCASDPQNARVDPPAPAGNASDQGSLEVYSARRRMPVDLNAETYFWNNDFGRNDFLYEPAHTDYAIYAPNGTLVERVRNARAWDDGNPTRVTLPAGAYTVEARTESSDGVSKTVDVALVIKAGETTAVHLERDGLSSAKRADHNAVAQTSDGHSATGGARPNGGTH